MRVYFDRNFKQWCAVEITGTVTRSAWGDTKEEAIRRFNKLNEKD